MQISLTRAIESAPRINIQICRIKRSSPLFYFLSLSTCSIDFHTALPAAHEYLLLTHCKCKTMNGRKNSQNQNPFPLPREVTGSLQSSSSLIILFNSLIPNTMKKLNLHHFHHEEIEKQEQNLLTGGGVEACICVGVLCDCFCGESDPSRALTLGESRSLNSSDMANRSDGQSADRKTSGGGA